MNISGFKYISLVYILYVFVFPGALMSNEAFGAGRFYVTQEGAGTKDGASWENAASDLKSLIDGVNGETEIWVAAGSYSPGERSGDSFSLKKGFKIYGGFSGVESALNERDSKKNVAILSGGNLSRSVAVVTSRSGALSGDTCLDGFTVTGGVNMASGGGLYVEINSNPIIADCVFLDNTAFLGGGGVYVYFSSPVMIRCAFSGNKSVHEHGGGASLYYSSPVFSNCTFIKNNAQYGGGVFCFESKITVENSSFTDNRSFSRGAGISGLNSGVSVSDSAFSGNHAEEYGGGMYCEDSEPVIINCVFSSNRTSPGNGGGVANIGSDVKIIGCEFSMNEADFFGGGMANTSSSLLISGCVYSDNKAKRFSGGGLANWNTSLTISDSHFSGNAARSGGAVYNHNSRSIIEKCVFSGDEAKKAIKDEGENSGTELKDTVWK